MSGKIEKNIAFWPIPIFRPNWAKWIPTDTRRNDSVIMIVTTTSQRRFDGHNVGHHCVVCPLGKVLTPSPPCFALCSVSGQWEVLGIPIPTPPDVDLLSSMTNQLNGCPHFFVFVSYTFFLKIDCDLQIVCYLCRERQRFQLPIGCWYTRIIYIYIYEKGPWSNQPLINHLEQISKQVWCTNYGYKQETFRCTAFWIPLSLVLFRSCLLKSVCFASLLNSKLTRPTIW